MFSRVSPYVAGFVGVDGGADHLLKAGIAPEAVVGDLDSLSSRARATFSDRLFEVAEQSTTDFEKAVTRVEAKGLIAIGFTGGRIDHALSVLNVMARHRDRPIFLLDEADVSWVLSGADVAFDLPKGTRVSVMPLGQAQVTVTGLVWPFADQAMSPDGFTSPSNAAIGGAVTVAADGPVLITVPQAHLPDVVQAVVPAK
ncbi:MAG: thiamine diphosphokinase [Pseudomonadota bacterium]